MVSLNARDQDNVSRMELFAARRRFAAKRDKMKNMRGKSTDEEEEEEDDEDAEDEGMIRVRMRTHLEDIYDIVSDIISSKSSQLT